MYPREGGSPETGGDPIHRKFLTGGPKGGCSLRKLGKAGTQRAKTEKAALLSPLTAHRQSSQRAGWGNQELGGIQTSPAHTTLVAQRTGLGSQKKNISSLMTKKMGLGN